MTTTACKDTEQRAALDELLGSTTAAPVSTSPPVVAAPVLRDGSGRFLPGTRGGPGAKPGRGLDLRALAEREAEREGFDLTAAAWRVLRKLFLMAEQGDVAAAKELFSRIGMVEDGQQAGVSLTVVTGVDQAGQPAQGIALRVTGTGENPA